MTKKLGPAFLRDPAFLNLVTLAIGLPAFLSPHGLHPLLQWSIIDFIDNIAQAPQPLGRKRPLSAAAKQTTIDWE